MEFIVENWVIIVVMFACIAAVVAAFWRFTSFPTKEQIKKVKEWLLWAVTEAEKELGSGTGKIKLRQVYDLFIQRFSWIARIVTFEYFSELVDEALVEMRKLLEENSAVKELVEGTMEDTEKAPQDEATTEATEA